MAKSLELPDQVYEALERAAESSGMTPAGWIAARLPRLEDQGAPAGGKTLADRLAGRIGRIHSGGRETLSEGCGEKFAEYLEQKRREGRL